jgi:JmjC domain, hydroxylase
MKCEYGYACDRRPYFKDKHHFGIQCSLYCSHIQTLICTTHVRCFAAAAATAQRWYGIPEAGAEAFEAAAQAMYPDLFASAPDLLHQLVTMIPPPALAARGVPVCCTTQVSLSSHLKYRVAYCCVLCRRSSCVCSSVSCCIADVAVGGEAAVCVVLPSGVGQS